MSESKYHFERLTPVDDMNLKVYEEAMDYVFDNQDIKNVAVSGAYSSGKSSVLASYKKKHNDKKFIHISLAHFKSPNEEKTEVKESVLEGKILNQLIHQIPSEKIPQTNFRIKKRINNKNIVINTLEIIFFSVALVFFLKFNFWKSYVFTLPDNCMKDIFKITTSPYALLIDGIVIVILLSSLIYRLVKIQKNKNIFRKLNIKGNEIEIFEESNDSYFDKYLNEVLYLFENVDADAIVFEDMDRFNANKIFERLHEVNTLVNIQLKKDNHKSLRFFYLLRDDIFVSKDRTKFFDYIIPVVPVVDSSNSYDQFILLFEKAAILEKFNESFLQGLSLYIDDMRILKNIYNEFIIYYNRLNTTELDCDKMLAIITYKNLFPRDFADLQLNQGFVYTLFNNKDKFIVSDIEKIKENINEIESVISSYNKEHLVSVRELNAVFVDKYLKGYAYSWLPEDDSYLSDHVISYLSEKQKNEYMLRKQALEYKLNENIDELEQEILNLKKSISKIKDKKLHQIITRENIDTIFSTTSKNEIGNETDFNEIKGSEYFDLLKYLIRNGYIDETYADYMTYFYEGSLSRIDKMFLRSITDKKAKEYTYNLKKPQLVISRLKLADFDQEEILNFDLLTYLLQSNKYDFVYRLIEQLKNMKNFGFIGAYFDINAETSKYIECLNIKWPELFSTALDEQLLTSDQIRRYSILTLYYSDDDVIEYVNINNCLCNYISDSKDYLMIDSPKIDKLIHCFKLLEVRFTGFDYTNIDKDLFYAVYKNSLYEINAENLQLIQSEILKEKDINNILHKNYTVLCLYPDSEVTQYMNSNINEYIDVYLEISDEIIYDDENVAVSLLNNDEITAERKEAYISQLQTTITFIKEITDLSLWPLLLDEDIVDYSECNIMDCFNALELDESVITYINRINIDLDFSKEEYDVKSKDKLFGSIILCNDIDNLKYRQILNTLGLCYRDFNIPNIHDDKIKILIDIAVIKMSAETLKYMRKNYPNTIFYFIQKYLDEYVDIIDNKLFSEDELLEILNWNISDDSKIRLLEWTNKKISIIDKDYSSEVCLHILENNLAEEDLPILFSTFDQWDDSVKSKIFEYAVENIVPIIDASDSVPYELKKNLLNSDELQRDYKIDLFIAMMSQISEDDIKEILLLLNLNDYLKIFDSYSRPRFEINAENKKLLNAFTENHIIQNYERCQDKDGYYKIYRVKNRKKGRS